MIVFVGIPVLDGKPYAKLVDSLLAEQLRGFGEGVHLLVDWESGCSLIGHARNRLAQRFLDARECDVMVFVDADISWQRGALIDLAKSKKDVVGGTYRAKQDEVHFHIHGKRRRRGDLYSVGGLPGGFLKISRRALNRMKTKARRYQSSEGVVVHDFFPMGWHRGVYYGEDYGFCRLWREIGGAVWLDPSIRLRHHDGGGVFTGDVREWLERAS